LMISQRVTSAEANPPVARIRTSPIQHIERRIAVPLGAEYSVLSTWSENYALAAREMHPAPRFRPAVGAYMGRPLQSLCGAANTKERASANVS
jgi:hypothetical protein